jgi:hypothetical protein
VRTATFLERLVACVEVDLEVTTACPRSAWTASLEPHTRSWRALACDAGVVQSSELAVDREATARALDEWDDVYERRVEQEAARLRSRSSAVLADVPPLGLAAAHAAGIPGFALANFSWDWVYRQMGFARSAARAACAYAQAHTLLALAPAAPMPAFPRTLALGTLGRTPSLEGREVRRRLGLAPHDRLVLVAFREPKVCALPPPAPGVRYVRTDARDAGRTDVVAPPPTVAFIDLVGAADVVVAKAGYGIVGDTAACGTALLYAHREGFPEDEVLARWLAARPATAHADTSKLAHGDWRSELDGLLGCVRPQPVSQAGVEQGLTLLAAALR